VDMHIEADMVVVLHMEVKQATEAVEDILQVVLAEEAEAEEDGDEVAAVEEGQVPSGETESSTLERFLLEECRNETQPASLLNSFLRVSERLMISF